MLADVIDHIEFKHNIRTDGLTMSIYSSIMVAVTPICNAAFMAMLNATSYVALDAANIITAQSANVQVAIGISYIWIETVAYAVCALLILLWTVIVSRILQPLFSAALKSYFIKIPPLFLPKHLTIPSKNAALRAS